MRVTDFGAEGVNDSDRGYAGSRYAEVVEAIFANPYQRVWGAANEPALPMYDVTLTNLLKGGIVFATANVFNQASTRAIDASSDLRWGTEQRGYRRLLHPNGVCLTGRWTIDAPTDYTGYFGTGSTALTVARYSTCCTETRRGHSRSLAMVGKLFPTVDAQHAEPLRTANFITQEDIGGADTAFVNDVVLLNAPDTTLARRGGGVPILLTTGVLFNRVDAQPTIRQIYPIAELGKPAATPTRAPAFMRLLVAPEQPRLSGEAVDFRDEVMAQIFDRGDATPRRTLRFTIEVTDEGETSGTAFRQRRTFSNWRRIGSLTFDNAVISYNGDFVIHFNHPTWREDRNDPATATRVDGRKIR